MTVLQADLGELRDYQRERVAWHLDVTYNLHYGHLERTEMHYFRCGLESVQRTEPEAVGLRLLAAAVRAGPQVRVTLPDMSYQQKHVFSEKLAQSERRPGKDGDVSERPVAAALEGLRAQFDRLAKVRSDQAGRAAGLHGVRI